MNHIENGTLLCIFHRKFHSSHRHIHRNCSKSSWHELHRSCNLTRSRRCSLRMVHTWDHIRLDIRSSHHRPIQFCIHNGCYRGCARNEVHIHDTDQRQVHSIHDILSHKFPRTQCMHRLHIHRRTYTLRKNLWLRSSHMSYSRQRLDHYRCSKASRTYPYMSDSVHHSSNQHNDIVLCCPILHF